jgi:hypothetical protein
MTHCRDLANISYFVKIKKAPAGVNQTGEMFIKETK